LSQLVRRRRIGEIAAEIEDEEDPHGVASGAHWVDRPPQVWYRRETYVVAPIGTRFRKQVWTPVRDPKKGVWFDRADTELELRGEGKLVSLHVLAERAARKAQRAAQPERPASKEEALQHLGAILSELGSEPPAGAIQEDTPATPAAAPRRRRRPVELQSPPTTPKRSGRKIA
jgi:hypothetical protein